MSDSIDKPETTNPGSRTPAVEEAPESPSGTELTMETLDTMAAGGNMTGMTAELLRRSQTLAMEQHLRKTKEEYGQNPTSDEEFRNNCNSYPRIGVEGVSGG